MNALKLCVVCWLGGGGGNIYVKFFKVFGQNFFKAFVYFLNTYEGVSF
jgi:hypothetical protein